MSRFRVLLLAALLCLPPTVAADIHIDDPWIKEAPPGVRVMAGYLLLENRGDESRVLTAVSSPMFERIELHRSVIENDVARMEARDQMTIAAGGSVSFEPGGYHLMLFDPHDRFEAGNQIELLFDFADGEEISITAVVRRDSAGHAEHHDHHHHHHH